MVSYKTYLYVDVIEWKHFPCHWPFVRRIHLSPVNSPEQGQRRGALMFSLIRAWINGWVNNRGDGDLRRHRAHYHVIVMEWDLRWYKKNLLVYMWPATKHIWKLCHLNTTAFSHIGTCYYFAACQPHFLRKIFFFKFHWGWFVWV